ncbi:MFS transporter [Bacillus sp. ISL-46]|uniref:MFS transporter n=1 Tax=Bacillus sp. ISL-46 TaxID=2819129 RepID=UPI0027DF620A|nr:MFS transporter [Bacillus sp. ISL-46]
MWYDVWCIFFGILADRIGRKNVIAITFIFFSVFTFLCGFAETPTLFSTFRFLAGLGLGGIMPNVIALLTDYAPKSMKSMIVSIVLCGYSVGGLTCTSIRNLFDVDIRLGIYLLGCRTAIIGSAFDV